MSAVAENPLFVDVICLHQKDGHIIPLKVRIKDEDGEYHNFMIKGYKDLTTYREHQNPYGYTSCSGIWVFECKIQVFNNIRHIVLYYNSTNNLWRINAI